MVPRHEHRAAGFTLLNAAIGLVMVVIAIYGFIHVTESLNFGNMRSQKRAVGETALATVAMDFERMQTDRIEILCNSLGAISAPPAPSHCLNVDRTAFAPTALPASGVSSRLGQRLAWDGTTTANGPFCVDLVSCKWRAGLHMLELSLQGLWFVPTGQNGNIRLANRNMTLRRAR